MYFLDLHSGFIEIVFKIILKEFIFFLEMVI
ncbi:hypothetical protein HmCmsJML063_04082 [Escherichia coli]|nr:hypothetical protein HmCmsJML063_04082 [Escherichia coli]